MYKVFLFNNPVVKFDKFNVGVPLPRGQFFSTQNLQLVDSDNKTISARINPLQFWPDQSIKWIHFHGQVRHALNADSALYLTTSSYKAYTRDSWVFDTSSHLNIKTACCSINVSLHQFFALIIDDKVKILSQVEFTDPITSQNNLHSEYEVVFDSQEQPLFCRVKQTIDLTINHTTSLILSAQFSIYYADASVIASLSLHNTEAIEHNHGKWDLGNKNSVYLKHFSVNFDYLSLTQNVILEQNQDALHYDSLQLKQCSSGGDNWNCATHKTRNNAIELPYCGAKGLISSHNISKDLDIKRPEPFLHISLQEHTLSIFPQHFWQKFPSGINSDNTHTNLNFADKASNGEVELQPGEIKAHAVDFSVNNFADASYPPAFSSIRLCTTNLHNCEAIPFINKPLLSQTLAESSPPLAHELVSGVDIWLKKREIIDEFGWRNFGDLYADHEAADHHNNEIFVSHYNNQYDPLYGFLKQWLVSGDSGYKELADNLFDHIVNIDIYHTNKDKPDYNNGLFWHTDHYVPAETATHRTYSVNQASNVYMDHAGSGGPGAHHCYSSGLALYYFLTGHETAKLTTLTLCDWMRCIYEGDGTLLGLIFRAKNTNQVKIPFTNKLLLGFGTGVVRNVFTNQYPLDRGTGNYVNILVDCFELTHQQKYITRAEFVILNTISNTDNIAKRNFADIENTWHYVVFLQAVIKYLFVVSQQILNSTNSTLKFDLGSASVIKAAFIHYAQWMAKNESPTLASKDVLEFPNDTWSAQDLRKIQILLCAYEMTENKGMLHKANSLIDIVYPALIHSNELHYTRVQALIMQNFVNKSATTECFKGLQEDILMQTTASPNTIRKDFLTRVIRFITHYSIRKEIALLCVRIPAFRKVFGR